jgi:hypothetical protein
LDSVLFSASKIVHKLCGIGGMEIEQRDVEVGRILWNEGNKNPLRFTIQQILNEDEELGYYLWPSAILLSEYLYYKSDQLKGKRVLEVRFGLSWSFSWFKNKNAFLKQFK